MKNFRLKQLLVAMVALLCSVAANAHDFMVDGIFYNINTSSTDLKVAVTYKGSSYNEFSNEYKGTVVIPESVTYNGKTYSVTSIGNRTFYKCSGLTSVIIGSGVTSIGDYAFSGCTGLTSVTIPNSVTSIGYRAFASCSGLTSVIIGSGVTSIGSSAFYDCDGLTSIVVKSGNTKYDSRNNCNAIIETSTNTLIQGCKNTIIPNSVTSIGNYAFGGCTGLTSIAIPNSVTSIEKNAFSSCTGLTSIAIPNSVTSIGDYAFYKCSSLASITIPNSVTSIGNYAFYDCSGLTNVTIGNSVTSIGDYAFDGCSGLTKVELNCSSVGSWFRDLTSIQEVILGNSVTIIGSSAFYNCSALTSVTIGNSVTSIGNDAFYGTAWYNNQRDGVVYAGKVLYKYKGTMPNGTSIKIKDGTVKIANKAFYKCTGLTNITIPNSVTSIGGSAFNGCSSLTSIKIPNSVTSIGTYAFNDCTSLKELCIEDGKTTLSLGYNSYNHNGIGKGLFYDCPLESLYLGRNLEYETDTSYGYSPKSYGYSPFYGIEELKSVTISNSVTSIGDYLFSGCTSLTSIVVNSGNTKYDSRNNCNAIIEKSTNMLVVGCKNTVIPNSVTSIGSSAFKDCSDLVSITIPNSVTSIGAGAFSGTAWYNNQPDGVVYAGKVLYDYKGTMPDGTSIKIKDGTVGITDHAFAYCSGLTSVEFPSSVKYVGMMAFQVCSGLNAVYISDLSAWCKIDFTYTSGQPNPLSNAHNLYLNGNLITELVIPEDVTEIKAKAFNDCYPITKLTLHEGITRIGPAAFWDCRNLTSVVIPNSVTSIGEEAFELCRGLTSVTIGNGVTRIGSYAFSSCWGLTSVTIPNSVTSIGSYAFGWCEGLTSVTIGNGVVSIGSGAFYACRGLTSVTIGNSVTSIGNEAFYACDLKSIYLLGETPAEIFSNTFSNYDATLYVPKGALDAYRAAEGWRKFTKIIEYNPTDIEDVTEDAPVFKVTAGGVSLSNAEGKAVAVYTAGGALVEKIDSYAGEEITLDKGVYVVYVANKAVKVKL